MYFTFIIIILIASIKDDIFRLNIDNSINHFMDGTALFLKYWTVPNAQLNTSSYISSPLPGLTEGLSGGTIAGYNLGINKFITKDRLEAALIAFKFFTSKKIQKKYLISGLVVPAIPSIYEDEEVCAIENCNLYHGMQFIRRPVIKEENFIEYYHQYVSYMNSYLYDNKEVKDILEKIDNIRKIHYISIISEENVISIGLFIFILNLIVLSFILLSLVLLYIKKFKDVFAFLSNDLWFISIFGLVVLLGICFTRYGPVTQFKCKLNLVLLLFGYSLNMIPVLYKLIIIFPEDNKYSLWISNHKYIFILLFLLIDSLFSILLLIFGKNNVKQIKIKDGENFEKCAMNYSFGLFFSVILSIYFFILTNTFLLLIFIEWNQRNYVKDIRFIISILYIDILLIILQLIINIKMIKNYKSHFLINEAIVTIMVITHYILIYGFRVILKNNKKSNEKSIIKEALKMNENYQESLKNRNFLSKDTSNSVISKIIKYHYSHSSLSSSSSSILVTSLAVPSFTTTINNNDIKKI